jgi:hypothetical protein
MAPFLRHERTTTNSERIHRPTRTPIPIAIASGISWRITTFSSLQGLGPIPSLILPFLVRPVPVPAPALAPAPAAVAAASAVEESP